MKKNYLKPTTVVIELQQRCLTPYSEVQRTAGNGGVNNGGGDSGPNPVMRGRQARFSDWDWEEE